MLTVEEVRTAIEEARQKRDIMHKLTPANKEFAVFDGGGLEDKTLKIELKDIKNNKKTTVLALILRSK